MDRPAETGKEQKQYNLQFLRKEPRIHPLPAGVKDSSENETFRVQKTLKNQR